MKTYLAAAALALASAMPAQAAYISIHDDNTSTSITAGDYELGFQANGTTLSTGLGTGSTLTITDGTNLSFSGDWVGLGANGSFDIFVVASAGDSNAIARLVGTVIANDANVSTINGQYFSGGSYAITGGTTVVAGNPADFSFSFSGNTLTVDQVPEPAMLGLFGLGALGVGLTRRRRKAA